MKNGFVIGSVLLLFGAAAYWYFSSDSLPPPEELTAEFTSLMERGDEAGAVALIEQAAARRMMGKIEVEGVVQDEAGNPVSEVIVLYSEVSIGANSADSSALREQRIVNGEFEFDCRRCSAIEATFSKEGYRSARHEWIAFSEEPIAPGVEERDFVVTLESAGADSR